MNAPHVPTPPSSRPRGALRSGARATAALGLTVCLAGCASTGSTTHSGSFSASASSHGKTTGTSTRSTKPPTATRFAAVDAGLSGIELPNGLEPGRPSTLLVAGRLRHGQGPGLMVRLDALHPAAETCPLPTGLQAIEGALASADPVAVDSPSFEAKITLDTPDVPWVLLCAALVDERTGSVLSRVSTPYPVGDDGA